MQYTGTSHKTHPSNLRTNKTLTGAVKLTYVKFYIHVFLYIKEYYSFLLYLQRYSADD